MDNTNTDWRKSTRSGAQTNCVEVHRGHRLVRDSKNAGGPTLGVDVSALVAAIREGRFDREW